MLANFFTKPFQGMQEKILNLPSDKGETVHRTVLESQNYERTNNKGNKMARVESPEVRTNQHSRQRNKTQ